MQNNKDFDEMDVDELALRFASAWTSWRAGEPSLDHAYWALRTHDYRAAESWSEWRRLAERMMNIDLPIE